MQPLDRGTLAWPLRRAWPRRAARRAASGEAALDRRRRRRARDRQDARRAAAERNPLVDALDGGRDRDEPDRDQPHLARLRAQAPPDRGVPPLPEPDRQLGADPPRRARRARQLLDPQNAIDPALAPPPPTLHAPFHANLQLLAQPRRALVRRTNDEVDQAQRPPLPPRPRRLAPHLDHQLERRPKALPLAQTADEILNSLASYRQRISDSGH